MSYGVAVFVSQIIDDDTNIQVRFPGCVTPCPRAEGPDASPGKMLAYPYGEVLQNVVISISHHKASLYVFYWD
jgi:hypothetical protein